MLTLLLPRRRCQQARGSTGVGARQGAGGDGTAISAAQAPPGSVRPAAASVLELTPVNYLKLPLVPRGDDKFGRGDGWGAGADPSGPGAKPCRGASGGLRPPGHPELGGCDRRRRGACCPPVSTHGCPRGCCQARRGPGGEAGGRRDKEPGVGAGRGGEEVGGGEAGGGEPRALGADCGSAWQGMRNLPK